MTNAPQQNVDQADRESEPILNDDRQQQKHGWQMEKATQSRVGVILTVGVLALAYWLVDGWNRSLATTLFETQITTVDMSSLKVNSATSFSGPLLLAALQFAVMGIGFLLIWAVSAARPAKELRVASNTLRDPRWAGLTICGAFSTFWLQSLMMPSALMSLGMFAASRAVELPVCSLLRGSLLGAPMGKKTAAQAGLGFLGAWLVTFSYAEIGNCLCIFTGSAVPLSGAALYLVYAMLLTFPAAHAVLEEGAVRQMATSPLLVLAIQNCLALVLFLPIIALAHLAGWEDVGSGLATLGRSEEYRMLVMWLCLQMMLLSGCRIGITCVMDSFWSVAVRVLKACFAWGSTVLMMSLLGPSQPLSFTDPHASAWSFWMLLGLVLVWAASFINTSTDYRPMLLGQGSKGVRGTGAMAV